MGLSAYELFDETIQKTQVWPNELRDELEWDHPAGEPWKERHREAFLARLKHEMHGYAEKKEPEAVARAVFLVLSRRVSEGEIEEVRQLLPAEIRDLWP